ncbi:MAG: AraC family transcriptional regulator ligand-binding domain-containing protein [Arenibacterium sp.]
MCDVAGEMGIGQRDCLKGTGLAPEDISNPDTRLTLDQEIKAIENFVANAPRKTGLGYAVGERFHVNAFGIWGFAILSSPTVRASIETAIKFAKLSYVIAEMQLEDRAEGPLLTFDLSPLPKSIHPYVLERHCYVALIFFTVYRRERLKTDFRIKTTSTDPSFVASLKHLFRMDVDSGADCDALHIPSEIIDGPLPKSDPVTLKFCLDQCRDLLEQISGRLPPWSQKVRDAVVENIGRECRIEDVAAGLSVTERTLRRRLTDEGTSFRDVYTDARLTIAQQLLQTAGLTVETVSWRVGYAEPASFVRAFSRKYGVTPGSIRRV